MIRLAESGAPHLQWEEFICCLQDNVEACHTLDEAHVAATAVLDWLQNAETIQAGLDLNILQGHIEDLRRVCLEIDVEATMDNNGDSK